MTEIKRTIAVVDSSLFGNDWIDSRKAIHHAILFVSQKPEDIQATARNEEGSQHSGLVLRDYTDIHRLSDCTSFKKHLFSMRRHAGLETVGQLLAEQVEKADLVSGA